MPLPKIPRHCPACDATLQVTRLTCPNCNTEVTGSFAPDLFSRLSANDFDFVVMFVRSRGNVKEMERELGISYWTIRSRLNEIVVQLGLEPPAPPAAGAAEQRDAAEQRGAARQRQQILEQLNSGQLTVSEAAALLEALKHSP